MTVRIRIFKERQQERVLCLECKKELAKGSLVTYHQTHHGMAKGGLGSEGGGADEIYGGDEPRTDRMAFPERDGPRPCQVERCSSRVLTRREMTVHFWQRHVRDTVAILE